MTDDECKDEMGRFIVAGCDYEESKRRLAMCEHTLGWLAEVEVLRMEMEELIKPQRYLSFNKGRWFRCVYDPKHGSTTFVPVSHEQIGQEWH